LRLGLAGYARNLRDGRVEVYAVGAETQLQALVQELRRGPGHANVTDVSEIEADHLPDLSSGFSIESEDRL
jgi:acylphosphatase